MTTEELKQFADLSDEVIKLKAKIIKIRSELFASSLFEENEADESQPTCLVAVLCDECGGSGIVAEITSEPKCCGRAEYGDCCNNPIPDWRQEPAQCHKCSATGYVEQNCTNVRRYAQLGN